MNGTSSISKGVIPTNNIASLPSTTSVTGYITCVGVGSSGKVNTEVLPSPGGDGLVLITFFPYKTKYFKLLWVLQLVDSENISQRNEN